MSASVLERWNRMHLGGYLDEFTGPIRSSWLWCRQHGLDKDTVKLQKIDDKQFEIAKEKSRLLFSFANKVLSEKAQEMSSTNVGLALFDQNSTLLRLYGNSSFFGWAEKFGMEIKTDWSEAAIGTNAVALGLKHKKICSTSGSMHYARSLTGLEISFAPCFLENESKSKVLGGIAILSECTEQKNFYPAEFLASSLAKEIGLRLFFSKSIDISPPTQGCISFDFSGERRKIIYINHQLCNILLLNMEETLLKNAEEVFDPLPSNAQFWKVVNSARNASNMVMPISIGGREKKYVVSSMHYDAGALGFSGLQLVISPVSDILSDGHSKTRDTAGNRVTFDSLIGQNIHYLNVVNMGKTVACNDSTVLLLGESGVGKDVFAQAIHNASHRKNKPFVAINCAALPKDLIASELFGYADGAFTGSKRGGHKGKIEEADGGTLFLDEIGDMPLHLQTVFLRFLEQKTIERLGSNQQTAVDVRIIAATNANLQNKVIQKEFREDLYYRLNVITLRLPSLRERPDDVERLANHFLDVFSFKQNRDTVSFSPAALAQLRSLPWNGNIRELKNLVESLVVLYPVSVIQPQHIQEQLNLKNDFAFEHDYVFEKENPGLEDNDEAILGHGTPSRESIVHALEATKYNRSKSAQMLGISRKTLYKWMDRYGL